MSPLLRRTTILIAPIAIVIAATLTSRGALAAGNHVIGVEGDYAIPIDSVAESGGGFGIRYGYQFQIPLFLIQPEIGFTDHIMGGNVSPTVYRGVAGVRAGIGEIVRLGVYGHLGVGHLTADTPGDNVSHTAFTWDGGAFFDVTVIPLLNLGVHGGYDQLTGEESDGGLSWGVVGVHGEFVF